MKSRRHTGLARSLSLAAFIAITFAPESSRSQPTDYPTKAVRIVVPYAAGASTDTLARTIALKLEGKWKRNVYVENLAGGGGLIGAGNVARSAPDGYSFVIVTASHVISPAIMARPPFDPIADFATVSLLARAPSLLLASQKSGIKSMPELIKKAQTEGINYGTSGVGSMHHVTMLMLANMTKSRMQHVAYRGSAQAMNDLVGGHLPLQMGSVSFAHRFVLDGKAAGLAVGGKERHRLLPNVPTLTELGYPLVSSEWWVLLAPAKTPAPIREMVSAEMRKILQMPDVKARMPADDLGGSTPDELLQFLLNEQAVWGKAAKDAGLHID
jgi:tripartite-type tricarboxylate transporter receptor subunit TctC